MESHPILDDQNTTILNNLLRQAETRIHNAQRMSYWTLAFSMVLVCAVVILSLNRKETYYSVSHNPLTNQPVLAEALVEEVQSVTNIRQELARFIVDIRSISNDPTNIEKQNQGYWRGRKNAQSFIKSEFALEDPNDLRKRGVARGVRDLRVEQQSGLTFAASWTEDTQDVSQNAIKDFTATIVVELQDPNNLKSDERKFSPFGVFISSISWSSRERK